MADEGELVRRAREGDGAAYGELVLAHQQIAVRVAAAIVGPSDAEDVAQDAFVKAYRALGRFRDDAPFRPWLLAIVGNEARNRLRSTRRRSALAVRVAGLGADPGSGPDDDAVDRARRTTLLEAVQALPDRDREVVSCRFLAGLSEAETAAALGWPPGTVKSRLSRALDRLRAETELKEFA